MIRAATVDDAQRIAAVHVRSWQAVYRGHFPDDFLDNLSVSGRAIGWTKWLADPNQVTGVYETPDGVVGFVSLGPSRDEDAGVATGELTSIYLSPGSWRCGIGTELMRWATGAARERGWTKMTLWVLEGNAVARAFYESCGWSPDGATKRGSFGAGVIHEVRYAWRASPSRVA
jgi:GNAT superfamily N-acetyltransferase